MPTATFTIVGLQSADCLRTVMNAIQDLPHIGYADVCLDTGQAEVEHGALIDEGDIRAAVEAAGYATR